jgi:hypothetical protein
MLSNSSSPGIEVLQQRLNKQFGDTNLLFGPFISEMVIMEQTDDDKRFSMLWYKEIADDKKKSCVLYN